MSEQPWIEWAGGKGECPVKPEALVEVRLRGGGTDRRAARDLYWDWLLPRCDQIIAYRVVSA